MRVERKLREESAYFGHLKSGATFEELNYSDNVRMKVDTDCLREKFSITNLPKYLAVNLSNGVLVEIDAQAEIRPVDITAIEI